MKILLIVFSLCIGGGIYFIDPKMKLSPLVRNYFPDALWAFAFTVSLFLTGITRGRKLATVFSVLLIAFVLELLQQYSAGTYDPLDLLAYTVGAISVFFISIPQSFKPQPA